MKFYKYQSLGNDYVLLDWLEQDERDITNSAWPELVKMLCARRVGVGADGVLVVRNIKQPEVLMFNADGSQAERCFNGLRCAASFLNQQKKLPRKFEIVMQQLIACEILDDNLIKINVGKAKYQNTHEIKIADKLLQGHVVHIGNPHFVILEKISLEWLQQYGTAIENYPDFPDRTNVEFVWDENGDYNVLVHERGCGITHACGTGAAAIMRTLYSLKVIANYQEVKIKMQGGVIKSYIDNNGNIIQIAPATMVYVASL